MLEKVLLLFIEMRYVGQNYELSISLGDIINKYKMPPKRN